jgi:hypothetical protein
MIFLWGMSMTLSNKPRHIAVFTLVVEYDDPNMTDGIGLKVMSTASLSNFHYLAVEHILDEMESAFHEAVQQIVCNGGKLYR